MKKAFSPCFLVIVFLLSIVLNPVHAFSQSTEENIAQKLNYSPIIILQQAEEDSTEPEPEQEPCVDNDRG